MNNPQFKDESYNEKQKIDSIFNSLDLIIFLLDSKGIILRVNRKACELFECIKEELIGQNWLKKVIPSNYKERLLKRFKAFSKNSNKSESRIRTPIISKNENERIIKWHITTLRKKSREISEIIISGRNVTKQNRIKSKLKRSEEKYRIAYDRASFYKDLFAHDINNILNNIKSATDLLSIFQNNPKKQKKNKELIELIENQVSRAERLISNVQKLSKLDKTQNSIKEIDAIEVLKASIDYIKMAFQDSKLRISVETPLNSVQIYANNLLQDVFENILINAIKYNDKTEINIQIKIKEIIEENHKYFKFEIIDNGIGIPDNMKEKVFHMGFLKDKGGKGMGFGLALVKRVIKSYKGRIWVEDKIQGEYTQGSNFIILIPALK
ncbi:MAG: PAS domain S-box protein [Candidatus Lokiarchaeota archaeon]|nr:PAS domain S-box protein [Candidatus Lokiarchaeota archaeon]